MPALVWPLSRHPVKHAPDWTWHNFSVSHFGRAFFLISGSFFSDNTPVIYVLVDSDFFFHMRLLNFFFCIVFSINSSMSTCWSFGLFIFSLVITVSGVAVFFLENRFSFESSDLFLAFHCSLFIVHSVQVLRYWCGNRCASWVSFDGSFCSDMLRLITVVILPYIVILVPSRPQGTHPYLISPPPPGPKWFKTVHQTYLPINQSINQSINQA